MGAAHTVCHTTATAPRQPMAALARGLGAACRISVARLRPAESDVRGMSSTLSKTVGAVRQVRGGAEACKRNRNTAVSTPRTCRTAPNVLLHVEGLPRTSLSAGRRRATLIRQAAPSPRAKATIGAMRGAWRVAVVWVLSCMGSEHAHCLRNAQSLSTGRVKHTVNVY